MATLGLSPTATLSTGNEVTSATMASCTSRVTRSADVLVSKCHCSILSRKSTRAPGTTAGGAGAWYIVTPMRCARPSRELSQPPGPSPPGAAAARTTRAWRAPPTGGFLRGEGDRDEGFVTREDVDAPASPPLPRSPGRSRGVPGETRARADAAGIADAAGDMASTVSLRPCAERVTSRSTHTCPRAH